MSERRRKGLTITIDGPSGAGKSTAAKGLARRLGYAYIDTGAMYRAVALEINRRGLRFESEEVLSQWVSALKITIRQEGEEVRIECEGKDVTRDIRSPEVGLLASEISKRRGVREALVRMQREMGEEGGVVLEGRDTGTVVFPQADIKFYLDARPEERAKRRHDEWRRKGVAVPYQETLNEVLERDQNDMNRSLSPLRKAEQAILIESTHQTAEEVIEEMLRAIEEAER